MSKISNAHHAGEQAISHRNLRARFGTAFVAGCLALSVCPAMAFAVPNAQNGQDTQDAANGNPPAAMQFNMNSNNAQQGMNANDFGQAPEGMMQDVDFNMDGQAPEGQPSDMGGTDNQAPEGQPADMAQAPEQMDGMQNMTPGIEARSDEFSNQVTQILSETYNITLPSFAGDAMLSGQPGSMGEAPELPEGAVNVQQIIDTAREVLREYSEEDLTTKLSDAEFVAALKAFALSSTEQRLASFAEGFAGNMEAPSDLPAEGEEAPADFSGEMPGTSADSTVMSSIIGIIMDVFGYVAD